MLDTTEAFVSANIHHSVRFFVTQLMVMLGVFNAIPPCHAETLIVPLNVASIQEALDLSMAGDTILVAPGTYTGPNNKNLDFFGKDLILIGTGGSEQTIIDCEFDGHGMNLISGESAASLVQGFTITNGLEDDRGGGIQCYCDTHFIDIALINNSANRGGGLAVSYGGSPLLENVLIQGNVGTGSGTAGGAYFCNDSHAVLRNVIFRENEGGGGGGVDICGAANTIVMENVLFENNVSRENGGGLYSSGSAVTLQDCIFRGNHAAGKGGGMRIGGSTLTVDNCRLEDNTADGQGGAIGAYWDHGSIFTNTLILNNTAAFGGGLYASEYTDSANTVLRNVTFAGNRSTSNAGSAICAVWQAEIDLEECLITGNLSGGALFTDYGAAIYASCNNVFGNEGGNYGGDMPDQTGINGNISQDPLLCDLPEGDYTVADVSPCLPENNDCGVLMGRYGQGCVLTAAPPDLAPAFVLNQNHPNPFNPTTSIGFTLQEAGVVSLTIFDLAGRQVRQLLSDQPHAAGGHAVNWDGIDGAGWPVSSGVYLYRMEATGLIETRKMTLLR